MGDLGEGLDIRDVVSGVANSLNVNSFCLVVNGSANVLGLVASNELGLNSKTWKHDLQLVVGAAVEVGRRDDVVALVGECSNGHELSGLAGGGSDGSNTALEGCDTLFEDINRRLDAMLD